jgi:hypothetical protein
MNGLTLSSWAVIAVAFLCGASGAVAFFCGASTVAVLMKTRSSPVMIRHISCWSGGPPSAQQVRTMGDPWMGLN